jgi:hypothetical protein
MSQVIVVKDLSNLGEQLKAALAGSGIDASQFGDIGVQIQKALADAGLGNQIVSGAVEAPVAAPPAPSFGEILETESGEEEFSVSYNVANAANIELVFDENFNLVLDMVSKDGEEESDLISTDDLDSSRVNAYVEDDTLFITIPLLKLPEEGDTVAIANFNPEATVEEDVDEDDSDEDSDQEMEWCDVCNEHHPV